MPKRTEKDYYIFNFYLDFINYYFSNKCYSNQFLFY